MSRRIYWLCMSGKRSLLKAAHLVVVLIAVVSVCLMPTLVLAQQASAPPAGLVEQFKGLAEKGNAEAQVKLADLYRAGKDVAQNLPEAVKWYRSAAQQGAAEAQFKLGQMYLEGKGVAVDAKEAASWLEKAAAQGHKAAKDKIAEMKSTTQDSVKDLNKALDLIR